MEQRRDIFQAIADPTRRQIISLIAREEQNVNSLSEKFNVSRQAVSLHLKILQECGVLNVRKAGRERICSVKASTLKEVADWVEPYRTMWENRFDELDNLLETIN